MQNLVEHLHKYFTLKTSEYFEQLLGDDNLDNFRVVFGDYLQQHKVLKVKSSCQTLLNVECFRDIKDRNHYIDGWITIKTFINLMYD